MTDRQGGLPHSGGALFVFGGTVTGVAHPRRWLPVVVLLSLGGACGGDAPSDSVVAGTTTTSSSTTETSSTVPSTTAGSTGAPFGTTVVSTPPKRQGLLASVQATADGKVDRVTFTFEGDVPGYRIGYVERPIVADGSGDEIQIDGAAVLEVHFEPASGFDLSGEGRQVYNGPNRLDLATRAVLDVARVGDFEANLVWVVGVDAKAPFRVRTDDPKRVIVEFEVPGP